MFSTKWILTNVSAGSFSCYREKVLFRGCSKLLAGDPGGQRRATSMTHTQCVLPGITMWWGNPIRRHDVLCTWVRIN